MTGLNILSLVLWGEGVRRTGEGIVGCQSKVQHEIDCHPELISGSCEILKHRGQSDVQKMLKQFQHDANSLKRTYLPIHLFSYSLHKKAAFTLAEVLITLGIIGIVAAMTLPALIANYQRKVLETSFKKSYSVVSQAVQRLIDDEGYIPKAENFGMGEFNVVLKNYIGSIGNIPMQGETFPNWFTAFYRTYNKRSLSGSAQWWFDDGYFTAVDGSFIFVDNSNTENLLIGVDTNGKKAPNLLGHDVFLFELDSETGALRGYDGYNKRGDEESKYCDKNSTSGLNGLSCSFEALKNPDEYFKNLP